MRIRALHFLALPLLAVFTSFAPLSLSAQQIFYPTEAETPGGWKMLSAFNNAFVSPPTGFLTPETQEGNNVIHIETSANQTTGTAYHPLIAAGSAVAGGIRQGTYVISVDAGNYSNLGFPTLNYIGLRVDGVSNPTNNAGMGTVIGSQTSSVPTPASGGWETWTFTLVVPAGDPLIGRSLGFAFDVDRTGKNTPVMNAAIDNLRMLPPQAAVSIVTIANTTNAAEPATNGVMTVSLSSTRAVATTVTFSVAGSATAGADYTALSGIVTIPAGALSAPINIPVLDDLFVESAETVVVTLTGVSSGNVQLSGTAANLTATNTIADDDSALPSIAVSKVASTTSTSDFDTILYSMTVQNTGLLPILSLTATDVLTQGATTLTLTSGPTVTDPNGNGILDMGETWTYAATYKINESNYEAGASLLNTFEVSGLLFATKSATAATALVVDPDLDVEKTSQIFGTTSIPATGVKVGDVVEYIYTIRNDGNVPMTSLNYSDAHGGLGDPLVDGGCQLTQDQQTLGNTTTGTTPFVIDTLAARDTVVCKATYTVVQADIDNLQNQ